MGEYKDRLKKIEQSTKSEMQIGLITNQDIEDIRKELTDMSEKVEEAIDNHTTAATIENTAKFTELKNEINGLTQKINEGLTISNLSDIDTFDPESIIKAIKGIKLNPVINVPQAKVVNKQSLFNEFVPANADVSNEVDTYFGYINSVGNWFIMQQSGTTTAAYKFVFGKTDYMKAWNGRRKLNFQRYDEAVNAVRN